MSRSPFILRAFAFVACVSVGCGAGDNPEDTTTLDAAGIGGNVGGGSDAGGPGSGGDAASGGGTTGGGTTGGGTTGGGGGASDAGGSRNDAGSATGGGTTGGSQDAGGTAGGRADSGADAGTTPTDAGTTPTDAGGGGTDAGGLARFSFFVISEVAIRDLSKDPEGFGGDLRFGETGAGAGLRGADKICATVAERSMAGAGAKQWRAFLSASTGGENGGPVNARDRIGAGPWYDRKGRLVGNSLTDLISGSRPSMADTQIRNDLPNETGTGNHAPDGTQVDNHDTLTGSDTAGRYVANSNTCMDWTSSSTTTGGGGGFGGSGPMIGHSWPRATGGGGGGAGAHWVSDHRAGGCGKGINTMNGTSDGTPTVGAGGGYGQFYCFALTP